MATWGASDIRYPAQVRANGKTLIALMTPEDAEADLAFGWSTSATAIDPRTDGHGILIEDKSFKVITPGAKVLLDGGALVLVAEGLLLVVTIAA